MFYQSIPVGTEVAQGTQIDIFISLGPSGGSESGGSGSGGVTKTFSVSLPTNMGDSLRVVVVDSQDNTVFDKTYDANLDTAAEVSVTGTGQEDYRVYINGNYYTHETINFDS